MLEIQKLFSFNQGRNIWRILLTDLDQIVIEERDIQNKEVAFSCIDRVTGEFFWKNKLFLDEKFWIGIEDSRSKYLILHQFEKPDMPAHKKIINVDLISGNVLWVNDDLTFYDMDDEYIYGYDSNFEDKEFYQLSIKDGTILNSLGNEEQSKTILNSIREKDYSRYTFAQLLDENSKIPVREITSQFIGENFHFFFCEFIDRENFLIFNYYDKISPQSLINRLIVYDKSSGKPVLIETLNSSTPAPLPDSFFMYDNDLYFIKNKNELVGYRLSP